MFKALLKHGVIVRALSGYNFPEWVRISVGTMEQNRKCIAALARGDDGMTPAETTATIAAVSTPPGEGAIALVRLSGPQAIAVADAIFRGKQKPSERPRIFSSSAKSSRKSASSIR